MTDFEFVNKLALIPNKRCKLIKCKNNRAFVEIYTEDGMLPKYKLKFTTIHNARVLARIWRRN